MTLDPRLGRLAWFAGLAILVAAPFIGLYPIFIMTALCLVCWGAPSSPQAPGCWWG